MISLLIIALLAQSPGRLDPHQRGVRENRRTRPFSGPSLAFFEAFPTSGAGTTTACSTTPPTGARGEALTFTRASNGTCTKTASGGLATTGIANGDLVVLSSNVARVEYDGAGTLGLLVEATRTNSLLRSQELSNVAWSTISGGGPAVPTVTADAAVAPDGTTTAERLQIPASSGAGFSLVEQVAAAAANPHVSGCFVIGNAQSGTIDIASRGVGTCIASCAYVATSWTRCLIPACAAANTTFDIGNYSLANGGVARNAADVFVWGCDREDGAYATSYIPTTSAAATRSAEAATFTVSAIGPTACLAASVQWPSTAVGAVNFAAIGTAGNDFTLYRTSDTAAGFQINATVTAPTVSSMGTTVHRAMLVDNAGTRSAYWDGVSVSAPAATMASGATVVSIGTGVAGGIPANGVVSRIQSDNDISRCAP